MHQSTIVTVGSRTADVDVELAPLIEALWRLGIDTTHSCQGSTGQGPDLPPRDEPWGYIRFPDVEDFRRFLELFSHTELSTRRFRSDPGNRRSTTPTWERAVFINRSGPGDTVDQADGVRLVSIVRFPSSDIEAMTEVSVTAISLARNTYSSCWD